MMAMIPRAAKRVEKAGRQGDAADQLAPGDGELYQGPRRRLAFGLGHLVHPRGSPLVAGVPHLVVAVEDEDGRQGRSQQQGGNRILD